MKRLISILCIALTAAALLLTSPAKAEPDLALGKQVFSGNCASCHMGGKNVVMANKTLQKGTLAQYGMDSMAAIQTQVTKGKNAMPAFGGRLSPDEIESVAAFVLARAEADWK